MEPEGRDPFSLTADTRLYVARAATERALDALVAAVERGAGPAALTGPAGLGKTLLLHVLAARCSERRRAVYLPYASLSAEDLCAWVLAALDASYEDSPQEALARVVEGLERAGESLLLLVDDAGALPIETARWLGALAAGSAGRIALAVATGDNGASGAAVAALGHCEPVRLSEAMDDVECAEYLRARLALAGVPDLIQARFDDASVRRLHAISGGNPRRLHIAAADLLRGGSGLVPEDLFTDGDELAIPLPPDALDQD